VAPDRLGLAAYSPPIDAQGTSPRAHAVIGALCDRLDLHVFEGDDLEGARVDSSPPRPVATGAPTPTLELERALEMALAAAPFEPGAGAVANYAPQLARALPGQLGVAICTVDGILIERGESRASFTLQAASNPFAYARALEAVGRERVHERVGVEPSGNAFHAIVLDPRTGHPFNPLGNSGAITMADLAPGTGGADRLRRALEFYSRAAGEPVGVDAQMLESEWKAGDRNRAIAALLAGSDCLDDEQAALELYLQQCCVEIDAVRLARLGALLARGGRPVGSDVAILSPRTVRDTLSVMYTCGLHGGSGAFASQVGIPAKSGISGALVAVVPGRLAIATWSPAVDRHGTSVRGLALLRALSSTLHLGAFAARPGFDVPRI
jgi:glutaminase